MAWQNPKTDWAVNPKNPVPEDFNRIEGNIDFLKGDIETKKGAIVNALNTVGLETQLTDTHAQIANKIVAANQGTKIYTPSTVNQPIPKGFHSGQGYVKGDANLVPENIAKGKSIFGVQGALRGAPAIGGILFHESLGLPVVDFVKGKWGSSNFPLGITESYIKIGDRNQAISMPYDYAAVTDETIDLTYVQRIVAIYYTIMSQPIGSLHLIASTLKNGAYTEYDARASRNAGNNYETSIISLDAESLTGQFYIRFHVVATASGTRQTEARILYLLLVV